MRRPALRVFWRTSGSLQPRLHHGGSGISRKFKSGMKSLNILNIILANGLIFIISLIISCDSGEVKIFRETRILMGTVVEISVAHRSESLARAAIAAAMRELQRVDDLMSHHNPASLVSRVNRDGYSGKVVVGEDLFYLLRDAHSISRASNGAFDVTILPSEKLWGFDDGGIVPDSHKIADSLSRVGYELLIFDESALSVGFGVDGMGIDLGAIAKGWAVDRAMEIIVSMDVRDAIIDAGGDLRIVGARPGRNSWRIGVQHPREPGKLLATFELRDTAIVTSGDYQRFFMADGVRYHHLLDPATGRPASGCQSVTVLAATAAEADACSTAAFVLGPTKGLTFLQSRPGVRGLIVDAAGGLHWTDEALKNMARR